MFDLINRLTEKKVIEICGERHTLITKTLYVTESELNNWYVKYVMEDHSILVIAPFDDFMYFGRINNIFGSNDCFPEKLLYDEKEFVLEATDYQIVKQLCFGNPLIAEGEVSYADYSCVDGLTIISLAIVSRTNVRADVIAKVISIDDIKEI